jgi:DNA invertase Pin-like site-specific DNA recombinase
MKAAIYTRISRDTEGQGLGVARQQEECRDLAQRRGWEVLRVFSDNDRSAYSGKARPAYEQMLAALTSGEATAVVSWHPDRLHRSPKELERFIDLVEQTGAAVATVQGGDYDLSTPSGRMTARVVGAVARRVSEHKAARAKSKAAQLAQQGRLGNGGTRPFGYDDDFRTVRPDEAAEIRQVVSRLLGGASVHSVVTDLQARGVLTPTGKPWRSVTLRRMALSPRIAGLRQHQGKVVGKAEWEGVITEAEHYALRSLFSDRARRPSGRTRQYMLTGGLAFCGLCGTKLVARPKADGRRCYVCAGGPNFAGCGKICVLSQPVEDLLRDLIAHRLAGPGLAKAIADAAADSPDTTSAMRDLEAQEAKLEQLAADFAADRLTHKEWHVARDAVAARADSLRSSVASMTTGAAVAISDFPATEDAIRDRWDSETVEWRRRLTGLLVDRVVVAPAVKGRNFFDPSRVGVAWKT